MSRRVHIFLRSSLVVLSIYVGLFSHWWIRSPVKTKTIGGKQVRIVEFHFNALSYYTGPLWLPAFWFVERVAGYERGGYATMEKDSVIEYLK